MTKVLSENSVLDIRQLKVHFFTELGVLKILDGIDLWVNRDETLGIVGESGCGKTMTARSIMRLVPRPGKIVDGEIILEGKNLLNLSDSEMQNVRGNKVSMVFQEPMTSLNPVFKIGNQVTEILAIHRPEMTKRERADRALEILKLVGIPSPEQRLYDYPHQLSGGLRQRVMIAMALACGNSKLLIADEPTTALDVTTQAQILDLFRELQENLEMSIILITHDLGVIAEMANRVAVMYAGLVVEMTDVISLFKNPLHPYTRGLINSLPNLMDGGKTTPLNTIPGVVPNPLNLLPGCRFYNRCSFANKDICLEEGPILLEHGSQHWVRCANMAAITYQNV